MFVRACVSASLRSVSRSMPEISRFLARICWFVASNNSRILDFAQRHDTSPINLWWFQAIRTQKVASGPPLPCGCNLVTPLRTLKIGILFFSNYENQKVETGLFFSEMFGWGFILRHLCLVLHHPPCKIKQVTKRPQHFRRASRGVLFFQISISNPGSYSFSADFKKTVGFWRGDGNGLFTRGW